MSQIDLSLLAPPAIIEPLDYEAVLADMKADVATRAPDLAAVLDLESEPLVKLLEAFAYRETILRARINDAARAVMLAYALGPDLDQIGANYNVARLLVDAGDPAAIPPVPPSYETDADYRRRILLSLEAYTTAGSTESYIYHALSASGEVLDAAAISPAPGQVTVYVLTRTGDGSASDTILGLVAAALAAEHVRPLTDQVGVLSAAIVTYSIEAELLVAHGPDAAVVRQAALDAATQYTAGIHRLGMDISLSGIYRALHQPGVLRVDLAHPTDNIAIAEGQAGYCTGIVLTTTDSGG